MNIGAYIIGDEILSGKRTDKHLAHVIAALARRGMQLAWARYERDSLEGLATAFRASFDRGDVVLSFGGVGSTPDDHTRQAAALALGVPLERHPEAVAALEAEFGHEAYPLRVRMAEFPRGATIVPNPVNRVASFSIRHHHFFPGFPEMAWPMLEWVLDHHYASHRPPPQAERSILVYGAGESQLVPTMEENVARFPGTRLFSLPTILPDGGRKLELGVHGDPAVIDAAIAHLIAGVEAGGFRWEPAVGMRRDAGPGDSP